MSSTNRQIVLLCLLLLICWGASLKALAPSIYVEDSGQFVASAVVLGHNHPPGYVLYNLLGHVFTWLPLGEIALRVNLFSAASALGALLFLYLFTLRLFDDTYIALFTSLIFVFSRLFWFMAAQSEVYQLNLMFFGGAVYWLYLERKDQSPRFSYLLFFWLGLGFNNHYLLLFFAPLLLLAERWGVLSYGLTGALKRLNCLVVGYMVSIILPLRSASGVPLDWGAPKTAKNFFDLLRRSRFEHLEFARDISLGDKWSFIQHFFEELAGQFHWITLVFAVIGLFWLYRHRRFWLVLFGGLWLIGGLGLIWLLQFPFNYENTTRVSVYYLPVYWLTAVFLGAGLKLVKDKEGFSQGWQFLFLLLPVGLCMLNFSATSLRGNYLGYDQGANLLANLPHKAVLQALGNNIVFPLSYFQHVQSKRPDLTIFDQNAGVFPASDSKTPGKERLRFFTLLRQRPQNTTANPYGLLFREGSSLVKFPTENLFRWRYQNNLTYGEYEILAARYYFEGLTYLELGAFNEAFERFNKSTQVGRDILWLRNNLGQIYLRAKLYGDAKREFKAASRLAPFNAVVFYNLGLVSAVGEKDYLTASQHFRQALAFDPNYLKAAKALKMAEERLGLKK